MATGLTSVMAPAPRSPPSRRPTRKTMNSDGAASATPTSHTNRPSRDRLRRVDARRRSARRTPPRRSSPRSAPDSKSRSSSDRPASASPAIASDGRVRLEHDVRERRRGLALDGRRARAAPAGGAGSGRRPACGCPRARSRASGNGRITLTARPTRRPASADGSYSARCSSSPMRCEADRRRARPRWPARRTARAARSRRAMIAEHRAERRLVAHGRRPAAPASAATASSTRRRRDRGPPGQRQGTVRATPSPPRRLAGRSVPWRRRGCSGGVRISSTPSPTRATRSSIRRSVSNRMSRSP